MILTKSESYWAANELITFYSSFNRIDDYFRKRKLERIEKMPTPLFGLEPSDELFQSWDLHPQEMEFEIINQPVEVFENFLEITASFTPDDPPARVQRYCIQEKNSKKICGFIKMASPILNIKPRNEWLGRPIDSKNKKEMYRFNQSSIMGFIIVPTQPFGFNYLGGKLMAAISCSHDIRRKLNQKYNGNFCLFETTSLYGNIKNMSMYDGMRPYIRYKGDTTSNLFLTLSDEVYFSLRNWFYKKNNDEPLVDAVTKSGKPITGHKLKTQTKMFNIISTSLKKHDNVAYEKFKEFKKNAGSITTQKRFYTSTYGYENTREYLLGEVDTLKKSDQWEKYELENIVKWWKNKSTKRYEKIVKDGRLRKKIEVWNKTNINDIDIIR